MPGVAGKGLKGKGARADRRTASRFLELLGAMKRYAREELPPFPKRGMSEEKFRSLLGLRLLGRASLKSLAAHDGLSASAQCIMLNRLVAEGFAERADDPRDRRSVFYELTGPGRVLLNAEIARRANLLSARLDRLGASEKARFARGIETVFSGLEKLRASSAVRGRSHHGKDEGDSRKRPRGRARAGRARDT